MAVLEFDFEHAVGFGRDHFDCLFNALTRPRRPRHHVEQMGQFLADQVNAA